MKDRLGWLIEKNKPVSDQVSYMRQVFELRYGVAPTTLTVHKDDVSLYDGTELRIVDTLTSRGVFLIGLI